MYHFATLDPRTVPGAEANDKIFAAGPVYGIEVTVPVLAERCLFNLDPQHTGANANRAAIEDALTADLPAEGCTLATIRADLDAIGAMAILSMRRSRRNQYENGELPAQCWEHNCEACMTPQERRAVPDTIYCWDGDPRFGGGEPPLFTDMDPHRRVALVAESDKFARGGYPGPKPLPSREEGETQTRMLAAIAAAIADFKVPLADRVATMERWLITGDEPEQYRAQIEGERLDVITAMEEGRIKSETRAGGRIAVVESAHRAATSIGYSLAPVVVARNPAFKLGGGEAHVKFTVCAFEPKFADIKSALAELATLEPGWGGSPTIGGSPQGVSSTLTTDQVVEVVTRHLISD